jgi:hypothetical protein
MKAINKTFCTLLTLCAVSASAQVSNYTFTKETGQPWDITNYPNVTITNHVVVDDAVAPYRIAIPFPFKFNGTTYDSVNISENGFLWFGPETEDVMSFITQPISANHNSNVKGIISAMGSDLHPHINTGLTTTIKSGMIGDAPMRQLMIEWKNTTRIDALNDPAGEDTITFHIMLYEFMNRIEVAYRDAKLNPNIITDMEIGLRGATATDFNNRMTDATHNWQNTAKGNSVGSVCELQTTKKPEFGDLYVWMNLNQNPNPTGVQETAGNVVKAYPVPAKETLFVETLSSQAQEIMVYNAAGQLLKTQNVDGNITQIALDGLPAGMYLYTVQSAGNLHTGRFSILK